MKVIPTDTLTPAAKITHKQSNNSQVIGDGKTVSLSKFKGKPLVLYLYPADETPGCTKQACAFRDSYEKFKKAGAQVVGISGDDSDSHKWARKLKLFDHRRTNVSLVQLSILRQKSDKEIAFP